MREQDLYDLLKLNGDQIEGASYADAERLKLLGARSSKPHCAVYSWIVLDLVAGDAPNLNDAHQTSALKGQHGDSLPTSLFPRPSYRSCSSGTTWNFIVPANMGRGALSDRGLPWSTMVAGSLKRKRPYLFCSAKATAAQHQLS